MIVDRRVFSVGGTDQLEGTTMVTTLRGARALLVVLATLGLGLGFATAAAAATPPKLSKVEFYDNCLGTEVTFTSGTFAEAYEWEITVDGTVVWPTAEDTQPEPGQSATVFVEGTDGHIVVDFEGSPWGWPKTHEWSEPRRGCPIPEATFTNKCTSDGRIAYTEVVLSNHADATGKASWDVNGIGPVTMAPGVSGDFTSTEQQLVVVENVTGQEWTHTLENVCPTPEPSEPSEPPAVTTSPLAAPGGGGGLPQTGSAVGWVVGGAVVLLLAGSGIVVLTRRRRVRFTA